MLNCAMHHYITHKHAQTNTTEMVPSKSKMRDESSLRETWCKREGRGKDVCRACPSEPETEGCLQRGDVCCTHEMCLCQQFPFLHSMAPTLTRSLCLTNQLSRSLPPPPVLICSLASSLPPRFLLCNTELLLVNANNVVLNMTSSV